jgi:hypothetical protein
MALVVVPSTAATARTSTAAGTPTTAARSAGTAISLRASLIDIQCAAAKLFPVQSRDGFLSLARVGHFHERKSARAPGVTVGDQADLIDFAMRLKQRPQFRFRGAVREVPNKKFLHEFPFPVSQRKDVRFRRRFLLRESRRNAGHAVQWKEYVLAAQLSKPVLSAANAYAENMDDVFPGRSPD